MSACAATSSTQAPPCARGNHRLCLRSSCQKRSSTRCWLCPWPQAESHPTSSGWVSSTSMTCPTTITIRPSTPSFCSPSSSTLTWPTSSDSTPLRLIFCRLLRKSIMTLLKGAPTISTGSISDPTTAKTPPAHTLQTQLKRPTRPISCWMFWYYVLRGILLFTPDISAQKLQYFAQCIHRFQKQSGLVGSSTRDGCRVQHHEADIRLLHTDETAVPLYLPQQSELSCLCGSALCVRVLLLCSLPALLPLLQEKTRRVVLGPHQAQTGQFLRVVDLRSRAQPA